MFSMCHESSKLAIVFKHFSNILHTRLAAAGDKVYQLLAHGRWFSPGTSPSSTTKTGHHDIAESGVKTPKKSINQSNILQYEIPPIFYFVNPYVFM